MVEQTSTAREKINARGSNTRENVARTDCQRDIHQLGPNLKSPSNFIS